MYLPSVLRPRRSTSPPSIFTTPSRLCDTTPSRLATSSALNSFTRHWIRHQPPMPTKRKSTNDLVAAVEGSPKKVRWSDAMSVREFTKQSHPRVASRASGTISSPKKRRRLSQVTRLPDVDYTIPFPKSPVLPVPPTPPPTNTVKIPDVLTGELEILCDYLLRAPDSTLWCVENGLAMPVRYDAGLVIPIGRSLPAPAAWVELLRDSKVVEA